jgi:hypothetical protein
MLGTDQSKVTVTLRNPLDHSDLLEYYIIPDDHQLARDWVSALKKLLQNGNLLEKNYCFLGFPNTSRTLEYLCNELNLSIKQINLFNKTGIWDNPYVIEEYFTPDVVRFGLEYPIGWDESNLGLSIKHDVMNRLHNHFERLQGTVWELSDYYKLADYETKYAIRQLNIICHEIESLLLSQRKNATTPEWIRPSQITTFLHADRYQLTNEHRSGFICNRYDRKFGQVYMHWTQIGKTLFEVFRDEGAPKLDATVCEAITHLEYYSGEFDIEWGRDIVYGGPFPWHNEEQDKFANWLLENGYDINDSRLSLGYLPIGQVDLQKSFGTDDPMIVWDQLSKHLDILSIEVDEIKNVFDYCWTDATYKQQQIDIMKPGYDFSSQVRTSK